MPLPLRLVVLFLVGARVGGWPTGFPGGWCKCSALCTWPLDAKAIRRAMRLVRRNWWPIVGSWRARGWDEAPSRPQWLAAACCRTAAGATVRRVVRLGSSALRTGAPEAPAGFVPGQGDWFLLHAQFISHLVLITLMLVASLVDIDEQTIPDLITVPGTLLGFLAAAALPASLLPITSRTQAGQCWRFSPWPVPILLQRA